MKNQFQDIIPPDKRSIRNIPLPHKKEEKENHSKKVLSIKRSSKSMSEEEILEKEKKEVISLEERQEKYFEFTENGSDRPRGFSRFFLWGITIVAVLLLFLSITSIFKSARVSVDVKSESVKLSGLSLFRLNPDADQAGYSSIVITDEAETSVAATGEKQVSSKATGAVIIYNSEAASPQTLVAGTRLETPSGLIFKLDKQIVVPGVTKGKSKNIPGSIEAAVTAEKPGSDYNIPLSDFTIPGFKGTSKYNSFYGRSKTAMTGGNVGMVATIDESTLASTIANLKEKLELSLKEKAKKQLPQTQQTFDSLEKITYTISDPKLQNEGSGNKAIVKVSASAKIYGIDINSFARKLLSEAKASTSATQTFNIDFSNVKVGFDSESAGELGVNLEGEAKVIWSLNSDDFKDAVAGKSVSEVASIASKFEEIEKVSVTIKPFSFWNSSLPKNVSKISIDIEDSQ